MSLDVVVMLLSFARGPTSDGPSARVLRVAGRLARRQADSFRDEERECFEEVGEGWLVEREGHRRREFARVRRRFRQKGRQDVEDEQLRLECT